MVRTTGGNNLISRSFSAVILAAGYSSRMNAFKPMLDVGGMTAIERSIASAREAGINNIVVVTGHNRELLAPVIEELKEAYNEDYDNGMFSSIRKGISYVAELEHNTEGIFLMPVDCPLISSDVIKSLMQSADDLNFAVPVFEGKKGHPLYIPKRYFDEILSCDGRGGLKAVTDKYRDRMVRIPVCEEGCVMDMDTPEGYEEIKSFLEAGCKRAPLEEKAMGRNIYLVRHGQTKQHDEKMFIGRYDVPLAEDAVEDVKKMAAELAEELEGKGSTSSVKKIYTSPLTRAKQTAEIIKIALKGDVELCVIDDLQEISLGSWDGRPVREIKEKYPDEYDRRGKDIFTFKTGNKAENFYDVQYRAVKALRHILEEDDSKDIVLVTHSAVIRALENNLKGLKVDDCWNPISKCEYKKTNS